MSTATESQHALPGYSVCICGHNRADHRSDGIDITGHLGGCLSDGCGCEVFWGSLTETRARLIAAAPAMLEALEQADFFLSHSGNQRAIVGDSLQNPSGRWNQFTKTRDQVKAAIRLAKGESR